MFKRIVKDRLKVLQESPRAQKQPSEEWALQEDQPPEDKETLNGKKRSLKGMLLKVCIGLFVVIAIFAGRKYLQRSTNKKSRRKSSNI